MATDKKAFPANLFRSERAREQENTPSLGWLDESPEEKVEVGYESWAEGGFMIRKDHWVFPDGSASVTCEVSEFCNTEDEDPPFEDYMDVYDPGKWTIESPSGASGSWGGRWIYGI